MTGRWLGAIARWTGLGCAVGCSRGGPIAEVASGTFTWGPSLVAAPTVRQPSPLAPYARALDLGFDRPVTLVVDGTDGRHALHVEAGPAEVLSVPLVGLYPEATWTFTAVAADEDGRAFTLEPITFTTAPLPTPFPHLDLRAAEPAAMAPGLTLLPLTSAELACWLVALDADAEVAWLYDGEGDEILEATATATGPRMLHRSQIVEVDWTGVLLRRVAGYAANEPAGTVVSDAPLFHHDVADSGRGTWLTFTKEVVTLPSYPVSYDDPSLRSEADIQSDVLLEVDPETGAVLDRWPAADHFDPERIGYGSLDVAGYGYDWLHLNAVWPGPGGRLVSARHQDAVVWIDDATDAITWILGTHDNWSAGFADRLLEPVGTPFAWPYHQHGAKWLDGTVLLFDNGNDQTSPWTGIPPLDNQYNTSRVVAFAVDPVARTVQQLWSFGLEPSVFSGVMGDADLLSNGHVLGTFGFVLVEGAVPNGGLGRGSPGARIVEFDPATGHTVWDLDVWSARDDVPSNWHAYRAERIAGFDAASAAGGG